jgi:lipopolysaccharide transport protein LptA
MADSRRRNPAALLALCCWLAGAAPTVEAQAPDEQGFVWSADVLNSDFRSDTLELAGNVRVEQGPMFIEAQQATATDVRSDSSEWTFRTDVRVRTAQADLKADSAHASVVNGQITSAHVSGAPAEFEQRGGSADAQVRGRAGEIDYDFRAGVVRLEKDVWFTNGADEFRGDVVIYNVREERVQINPAGEAGGRVRGVIRPRERPGDAEPSRAQPRQPPQQPPGSDEDDA